MTLFLPRKLDYARFSPKRKALAFAWGGGYAVGFRRNRFYSHMSALALIVFILVPLVEIALFIEIGGAIGGGWTLLLIVLTAFIGLAAVRRQGFGVLAQAQQQMSDGQPPVGALAHGVLILLAGALLLTPGFFTDALGFLLLWTPVRSMLLETALFSLFGSFGITPPSDVDSSIIDGDYRIRDGDD